MLLLFDVASPCLKKLFDRTRGLRRITYPKYFENNCRSTNAKIRLLHRPLHTVSCVRQNKHACSFIPLIVHTNNRELALINSNLLGVTQTVVQNSRCMGSGINLKKGSSKNDDTDDALSSDNDDSASSSEDNDSSDESDLDGGKRRISDVKFPGDVNLPTTYRLMDIPVNSPRLDVIVKRAMNIKFLVFVDMLTSNRLRLNGDMVLKKSKQLRVGDAVDCYVDEDEDKVKRVRVMSICEDRTKTVVQVKVWRGMFSKSLL